MKKSLGLLLAAILVAGCNSAQDNPEGGHALPPPASPVVQHTPAPSETDIGRLKQPDSEEVVLQTGRGKIVFVLYPNAAPNHVKRIKELVSKHYYDGILFHRVIKDFMIQFGDPNTRKPDRRMWGAGTNDVPPLQAEFNVLPHVPGTVAMARTSDPDSATTQFYICVGTPSFLDRKYTVFGQVVQGQKIADQISQVAKDAHDAPSTNEKVSRAYLQPTPKELLKAAPSPEASASAAPSGSASAEAASPAPAESPSAVASPSSSASP